MVSSSRLHPQSGLALGIVLFALALIVAIGIAYTATGNFTGSLVTTDRVLREIKSQGDLIRAKINECYMNVNKVGVTLSTANYPSSTGAGTLVENLDCPTYGAGNQNLWTGQATAKYPTPPTGFNPWYYVNAGDSGGRCIRIEPLAAMLNDQGLRAGLAEAANGYSALERVYDSGSVSQRFIIWVTRPSGAASADCSS